MARQTQEPLGEVHHRRGDVVEIGHRLGLGPHRVALPLGPRRLRRLVRAQGRPPVDALRPGVLLTDVVAEGPRGVPDRGSRPVLNHVGDHRGVDAPKAPEDVLDDLLASVGLDVDVDVGRAVALGGEEALEQEAVGHRVDGGDPQRVADRGVGGTPPALTQDVGPAAKTDDVVDDEEVAGKVERLDHGELVLDLPPGAGNSFPIGRAVPLARAPVGELA